MRTWVHCNDSHWPLVVFEAPSQFSHSDLARHYQDLRRCARRQEEFFLLFDLSGSAVPDAEALKTWAEYRARTLGWLDGTLLGEAFVVGSQSHCSLVRALNELAPPEHLQQFYRSRSEATRWARSVLERHGLQSSPALRKAPLGTQEGGASWHSAADSVPVPVARQR